MTILKNLVHKDIEKRVNSSYALTFFKLHNIVVLISTLENTVFSSAIIMNVIASKLNLLLNLFGLSNRQA